MIRMLSTITSSLLARVLFSLGVLTVLVGLFSASGRTQRNKTGKQTSRDVVLVKPSSRTASNAPAAAAMEAAAITNGDLAFNLDWTFGGRSQKGWHLYAPLMNRLLTTEDPPESIGFAASVQNWQKRAGMSATGLLDQNALLKMVEAWQSRRLKVRSAATPDQLLLTDASQWYDPTRADDLRYVERDTFEAYRRMVQAAAADKSLRLSVAKSGDLAKGEQYLKIISAFRSQEYQDSLRKQSPGSGRAQLALNSPHLTGRALDLYVGGAPVDTSDQNRAIQVKTPVYKWLVKNASRFGFQPYFYEPWHWEYVGVK